MSVLIKWFPPSWVQIKAEDKILYIDPFSPPFPPRPYHT